MIAARAALLAAVTSTSLIAATAPTFDALFPAGAEHGSTNAVTVSGKFDPWPPKAWLSGPGVHFNAETNKGKFTVTIDTEAAPGARVVRFYNEEGVSEPRLFVVGEQREISETETNNHFARAQQIAALPITINGRLEKGGDVDSFAVQLRAGDELEARIDSYVLMSKLDAVLRLVTTNGHQLAWNHDFATLDPRLVWAATNDQTFVVLVYGFPHPATASVGLYGGDSAFYRLHLRAKAAALPTTHCADALVVTNGIILSAEDEPRVSFVAKKDQSFELRVAAAALGSPLDAWLKIEDVKGKQLARNDDAEGSRDPSLEWKAPEDGTFTAAVGSLTHRAGPDYRYHLTVEPVQPDFRATLTANSVAVTTDSTNSIKFNLKRLRGYTNELLVTFVGLPEGVTSVSTNLASKISGEVALPITVVSNAPSFSGPVQIKLTDANTSKDRLVPFSLPSRSEDNGVPGGYSTLLVEDLDHIWLTVKPKPAEAPKESAKK